MKAIIMAGGEGSRLRPLSCDRPKPMVPVANRPVMEYALELLTRYGIREIGVTLQHLPAIIKNHFGNGSDFGVNLKYFIEDSPLGTAGSVKNAGDFLDETFIVISGDALTDFNLGQAIRFHKEHEALATLVLTAVENPLEYGVVITDKEGRIKRFLEKPGWSEVFSDHVNTGIYILEPGVLDFIPANSKFDFSQDLFPMLLEAGNPLYGCLLKGYWCDIGDVGHYLQAHWDFLDGKVDFPLPGVEEAPRINIGKGSFISNAVEMHGPVLIGENCLIEGHARIGPYAVIGNNATIGTHGSMKNSVFWPAVYLGKGADARGTVLCGGVSLGSKSQVLEGSILGQSSHVGEEAVIMPRVKIWPGKRIAQGSIVRENIIWGNLTGFIAVNEGRLQGAAMSELEPVLMAKVGAALATNLESEARVVGGHDGTRIACLLNRALATGLNSAGVGFLDGGMLPLPATRFAVRYLGTKAGFHMQQGGDGQFLCRLLDERGLELPRRSERKVNQVLSSEEFRKVSPGELPPLDESAPGIIQEYVEYLLRSTEVERLREKAPRVAIAWRDEALSLIITTILDRLGCDGILFPPGSPITMQRLKEEVVRGGAVLGAEIEPYGEKIRLIDEKGRELPASFWPVLWASLVAESNNGGVVVVPVSASQQVDVVVRRYGARVIRCKNSSRELMQVVLSPEVQEAQRLCSQADVQLDALAFLVKLLNFMVFKEATLSGWLDTLPNPTMAWGSVSCPWEARGKVLRILAEENGEKAELLDGVKVFHPEGWSLILPRGDSPQYDIVSESFSMEVAESLTEMYLDKIRKIISK